MEIQIQKAIELSLASAKRQEEGEQTTTSSSNENGSSDSSPHLAAAASADDSELEQAIQLSQKELESHRKRQLEEEEMLKKALALSMSEK